MLAQATAATNWRHHGHNNIFGTGGNGGAERRVGYDGPIPVERFIECCVGVNEGDRTAGKDMFDGDVGFALQAVAEDVELPVVISVAVMRR